VMAGLTIWFYLDRMNQPIGCAGETWGWAACFFGNFAFFILFQNFYNQTYKKKE